MQDDVAFAEIYRRCAPRIRRMLARMLRDPEQVEDVMQDVFERIFLSLERFQGRSELATWAYRIALNTCMRHRSRALRRRQRQAHLGDALPAPARLEPEEVALRREAFACVAQVLAGLPELQRRAVLEGPVRGRDLRATAAALGVPLAVVKRQLHRARVALRRAAA